MPKDSRNTRDLFSFKHQVFRVAAGVLLLMHTTLYATENKKTYIIGAEDISYYPHYDFTSGDGNSFVKALLQEFAKSQNIEFTYLALPIKRLQLALSQGEIDFVYPDNPKWQKSTTENPAVKYFSNPITIAMGSTIVHQQNLGRDIAEFESLAVPYGFSPVLWMDMVISRKVRIVEVKDAVSALELVLLGRVSGADVEYHVAKHIMTSTQISHLVMDPSLPFDPVGFSLSSYLHPEMLESLNKYLGDNPELIERIQAQFGLERPKEILERLAKQSSSPPRTQSTLEGYNKNSRQ